MGISSTEQRVPVPECYREHFGRRNDSFDSTGVTSAAGSRVLAEHPAEMVDYAMRVTRLALFSPELALPPIIVAVVVAGAGFVATAVVRRKRTGLTAARVDDAS